MGQPKKTFLIKKYLKFTDQTTYKVLSSLTKNEALIKVLTAQYWDYGLPPRQSSFAMHASVVKHYFEGGSFPIGGSAAIVSTINEVLEAHGAQIMTNAEVSEIRIVQGKVIGVRMQDGRDIAADQVVSGVGIFNTYEQLIPETNISLRLNYRKFNLRWAMAVCT